MIVVLAASCYRCNEFKGAKLMRSILKLDNLRHCSILKRKHEVTNLLGQWRNHIVKPTGRATIIALRLNNEKNVVNDQSGLNLVGIRQRMSSEATCQLT